MKRNLFFLLLLLPMFVSAQNKMTLTDNFDNGKFQWDEYYENDKSAFIMDGFYVIENKSDKSAIAVADLPIDYERNFKIKVRFQIPKINDDKYFGVVFDYEDENNYSKFIVAEGKYKICNIRNSVSSIVRQGAIILKSGKNQVVDFEIVKKGMKHTFLVNNIDVVSFTRKLSSGIFGFITDGSSKISVDEITIEQSVAN